MQLAEKLNVTDRAVSKWETGRSLPDSSIMLELCDILKITVNDLLCGEVVTMEDYNKEMENKLVEMVKEKEESDRRLLRMEVVTGFMSLVPLIAAIVIANVIPMEEWLAGLIVGICVIPLLVATPFMIRIEQTAGYYQCAKCGHKHIPKYGNVFMAMHMGRTRYMKCPVCGRRSWQKKVLTKE
jgi:transcriptional regulator with XRE-family HTH domain/DNA-directed RNA polymerase subunit RPC12/RpoP